MKVLGFIPFWMGYNPQTGAPVNRAVRKLGGVPVINYSLSALNQSSLVAETVIFASNNDISRFVEPQFDYTYLERPVFLDSDDVSIEQIIDEFLRHSDADVIVLMHPNSPFIQLETIDDCIEKVCSGEFDSAFTAYTSKKFSWFNGRPLNYALDQDTPKLRDIEPVILEQSSLYVFTRKIFETERKRVGGRTYIKNINHFEGHDLVEEEDYELAQLIVNSGMFSDLP